MSGVLSKRQRGTLRAIAEVLFMTREGPPPAARLDWLVDDAEDFLRQSGRRATRSIKLLIFLVAWLAPWFALRPLSLRRMSLPRRARALDRMENSFAGAVLLGVKAFLCVLYYEHPDAAAEIGFDGGCLVELGRGAEARP